MSERERECVCVCVCVCVVVVVKRPVLPPCAVDGRSRNLLLLLLRIIIIIFYLKEVRTRSCGNFRISDANTLCSFIMPIHLSKETAVIIRFGGIAKA